MDNHSVQCHCCDATLPNTQLDTIIEANWGFVLDLDSGAPENPDGTCGLGFFYACPKCKDPDMGETDEWDSNGPKLLHLGIPED